MIYHTILVATLITVNYGQTCSTPSDCNTGMICGTNSACTFTCSTLDDCFGSGLVCKQGECQICSSNNDCGGGSNYCLDNLCVFTCTHRDDCALGKTCNAGYCESAPDNCALDTDCAAYEICIDAKCEEDNTCSSDADCDNIFGFDTCSLFSGLQIGSCYLPCSHDSQCKQGILVVVDFTCQNGMSYTGCHGCTICAPSDRNTDCQMDSECFAPLNSTTNAKCDLNRNMCYFSCDTESECKEEDHFLTCYDNPVTGYKHCVYGSGTFSSTMETDVPTIQTVNPSKEPTIPSENPTLKPSNHPTEGTSVPTNTPTTETGSPTKTEEVLASAFQYEIFTSAVVVIWIVSWM